MLLTLKKEDHMNTNPKISIIVPIYNIENYLSETLNSILKQSMIEEMEVLMIDDGSTDNSRYIIEEYALDYDNFYAYHKSNEGPSIARNMGIELAKGEYVMFLDSDDIILPDRCEKLYELAKKNDSDFVGSFGKRLTRYNFYGSLIYNNAYKNIECQKENIVFEEMPELIWDTFCTNKLYKKSFLDENDIRFIPKMKYEDIPFALEAYSLGNNISLTKDTSYLWRIRQDNNSSVTQQHQKYENFEDRIKMIRLCYDIAQKRNFNDEIKRELFFRWIDYDLILYLKIFYQLSEKDHLKMVDEIIKILDLVPMELKKGLNSTKKIMYKMVEERDVESLCDFSKNYYELMKNPHISKDLKDEYREYIDFEKDAMDEKLIALKEEVTLDENNVYITFSERINYLRNDYPHETKAKLIDIVGDEYELEMNNDFNEKSDNPAESIKQIIVPINLIKDKGHSKIKVEYACDKFKKESFLSNLYRGVKEGESFDMEIGIEEDGIFFMDMRKTNNLNINIDNIKLKDNSFKISGRSAENLDDFYIENVISQEKIFYKAKYGDDGRFSFSIPYEDILSHPVRKWEIRTKNMFNSIQLNRKYVFYSKYNKIEFENARKKILISEDIYNIFNTLNENDEKIFTLNNEKTELNQTICDLEKDKSELGELANKLEEEKTALNEENSEIKTKNNELKEKNKILQERNIKLNNRILEYKARFAVKYSDKLKSFLKNN